MYFNGQGVQPNLIKTTEWLKKAANNDHVMAQSILAKHYYYGGYAVERNFKEAFFWGKKAADEGNEESQYGIGRMYLNGDGVTQNRTEAFTWFKRAADRGQVDAKFELGLMYLNGDGVIQNRTEAFKWFKRAADKGQVDAKFELGLMYYNGVDGQIDYLNAVKYLTPFAEQNDEEAIRVLFKIFSSGGYGVPKNLEKAAQYFNLLPDEEKYQLSNQKNETGVTNTWHNALASMFTLGLCAIGYKLLPGATKTKDFTNRGPKKSKIKEGRKKQEALNNQYAIEQYNLACSFFEKQDVCLNQADLEQALISLIRAADLGHIDAQFQLGIIFHKGQGVRQDFKEAFEWFERAADQGHPEARCSLALMYLKGEGVNKDLKKAASEFKQAEKKGCLDASYFLSNMNFEGIGIRKNINNGIKLLKKAADKGHKKSQFKLAFLYEEGVFCDKDLHKASFWFDKLARQKHPRAPKFLANTLCSKLKNKEGDIEDLKAAAYWLKQVPEHSDLLAEALVLLKSVGHEMPNDYEPEPITMNVSTVDASAEIEVEPEFVAKQKEQEANLKVTQNKLKDRLKSIEEAFPDKPNELQSQPRGILKETPIVAVLSDKYANYQSLIKQCKTSINTLKYNELEVALRHIEKDMDRLEALKSEIEDIVSQLSTYRSYYEQLDTLSFPVSDLTDDEKDEKKSLQDEISEFKQLASLVPYYISNVGNRLLMDSRAFIKNVESRLKDEQSTRESKPKQPISGDEKNVKDKGKAPTGKGKGPAKTITVAQYMAARSSSSSSSAASAVAELTTRADDVRTLVEPVKDLLEVPSRENAIISFYALQQVIADLTEESRWSLSGAAKKEATATRHASHHGDLMILDESYLNDGSLRVFINLVREKLQGTQVDFNQVSKMFEDLGKYRLYLETVSFDCKLQALCQSFRTVCLSIDCKIKENGLKWTAKSPSETAELTINQFVPVHKEALIRLLVMIDNCLNKESDDSNKSREVFKSTVYSDLGFPQELNLGQNRRDRAHRGEREADSIGFDTKTILSLLKIGCDEGFEAKIEGLSKPRQKLRRK